MAALLPIVAHADEIGFLDDDFFFLRRCRFAGAQLAGWRVLYVPEAVVYHKLKSSGGGTISSYYDGRNFLYLIWKNYPTSLLKQNWPSILRAQWRISREALVAWRGAVGTCAIAWTNRGFDRVFKMWPKRRRIHANRRVSDDYLISILTPVDETQSDG